MTPHAEAVRAAAHELTRAAGGLDVLLDRIGDAGCVLLGESTHGTSEFYALRAHITRRLVEEKGFRAVAVEADWPDAYRAGCWARGAGDDPDAAAALGDFIRFPRWVWRNREVEAFLRWLREHNAAGGEVGFYGLDLYSPGAGPPCGTQVVELPRRAAQLLPRDRHSPAAAHFFAEQNARLVRNAERHHRAMFRVGPESWNLRETHMAETLGALRSHLARDGMPGKVVVWAHNSHVGDARATEQAELGQLTLGQLAREAFGGEAVLVGLSTFSGTVTAASEWGGPATASRVGPAREDSSEALLHDTRLANFLLVMGEDERAAAALTSTRLQRAIAENELANRIELARREEQLVAQHGANERRRAGEEAAARKVEAEADDERRRLDAQRQADTIDLVEQAQLRAARERAEIQKAMPQGVLYALALQELAGQLGNIEHLSITPDLIGPLLARAGRDAR